jgi:hypothetical protein
MSENNGNPRLVSGAPAQPKPSAPAKDAPQKGAAPAKPSKIEAAAELLTRSLARDLPRTSKIEVDMELLSRSLARDLERIPREEWFRIESVPCRVGFTRDMAEGLRFIDAVANVVNQKGGLFASQNLDRRRDLEKCSEEIVDAFRTMILKTVETARRLNLTTILERHWRLLAAYGPAPKKADRPKPARPEAPAAESAAEKVA